MHKQGSLLGVDLNAEYVILSLINNKSSSALKYFFKPGKIGLLKFKFLIEVLQSTANQQSPSNPVMQSIHMAIKLLQQYPP